MKKAVCIISGGMDSTLCAYMAKSQGYEIIALHFDYNQRTMKKERECFEKICKDLGVAQALILDVSFIAKIGANALTDRNLQIPKNSLGDEIPTTYVPYRNGIFLSIAASLAEKEGAEAIFIGVIEADGSGYPDCTSEFVDKISSAINQGTATKIKISIKTPLLNLDKSQIVQKAMELKVPLELTWSCYESEDEACGECDSCLLRLRGFKKANISDMIKYRIKNKIV